MSRAEVTAHHARVSATSAAAGRQVCRSIRRIRSAVPIRGRVVSAGPPAGLTRFRSTVEPCVLMDLRSPAPDSAFSPGGQRPRRASIDDGQTLGSGSRRGQCPAVMAAGDNAGAAVPAGEPTITRKHASAASKPGYGCAKDGRHTRKRILGGRERPVTVQAHVRLKDVARLAQVSIATASRVLNGKHSVRTELRERVEAAAGKLA